MRLIHFILTVLLSSGAALFKGYCAEAPHSVQAQDVVWLKNGERLRGALIALDPKIGLSVKNPDISDAMPFSMEEIVKIRLGTRSFTNTASSSNLCWVRLINQDEMEASLVGCDSNAIVLESWYGGRISIPRSAVDSIQPIVANPKAVYEGPTGLDGWTLGTSTVPLVESNAWSYQDGMLVATASGSIARDLKLPDVATMEMDVTWNGYLNMAIALYSDSLQPIALLTKDEGPDFGGFYSLQLNINTVRILPVKKGIPLNYIGFAMAPGMETKTSTHLVIRMHRPDRAVYVYLDDVLVLQCRDPIETLGKGTSVRFVNQGPNAVSVSNIRVTEWDGRLDAPTNTINNLTNDVLRLLSREVVSGNIQEIRAGSVFIQSPTIATNFPLDKIEQIHLAQSKRIAVQGSSDVQAYFNKFGLQANRRGHLTLKLEGLDNQYLVASSPLFGRIKLNCAAFRTLEWR